ncbi:hypothetical protein LCGC14_3152450, partial [marine sediment metagenome]
RELAAVLPDIDPTRAELALTLHNFARECREQVDARHVRVKVAAEVLAAKVSDENSNSEEQPDGSGY